MKFSNTIKTVLKIYQKYVKNSVWFGTGRTILLFNIKIKLIEMFELNERMPGMRSVEY